MKACCSHQSAAITPSQMTTTRTYARLIPSALTGRPSATPRRSSCLHARSTPAARRLLQPYSHVVPARWTNLTWILAIRDVAHRRKTVRGFERCMRTLRQVILLEKGSRLAERMESGSECTSGRRPVALPLPLTFDRNGCLLSHIYGTQEAA